MIKFYSAPQAKLIEIGLQKNLLAGSSTMLTGAANEEFRSNGNAYSDWDI